MKENERYYCDTGNPKKNLSLEIIYLICMVYLFGFTVDYSNISTPYMVLLVALVIGGLITFYINTEIKRGKVYLFYKGDTLYMRGIFGSKSEIDMTNGYTVKETDKGVHYIIINNQDGKGKMLIGGNYKKHFSLIIDLLKSKQK